VLAEGYASLVQIIEAMQQPESGLTHAPS
jgi:hypothetical protein